MLDTKAKVSKADATPETGTVQQAESAPPAPPCAMVIFGAAGDLTKRLVVPALYNLAQGGQLSNQFQLVGVDHNARSIEQWRARSHCCNGRISLGKAASFTSTPSTKRHGNGSATA